MRLGGEGLALGGGDLGVMSGVDLVRRIEEGARMWAVQVFKLKDIEPASKYLTWQVYE